jgi:hypothetical protein
MDAVAALAPGSGLIAAGCTALGLSRASLHRRQAFRRQPLAAVRPRPTPMRALVAKERQVVFDLLRELRFVDLAPAEVYASLLDQGVYLCSIRTMYRVLAEHDEVRERRRQLRRPFYQKPELLAEDHRPGTGCGFSTNVFEYAAPAGVDARAPRRRTASCRSQDDRDKAEMADDNPLADRIVSYWFTRIIQGWVHTTVPFGRLLEVLKGIGTDRNVSRQMRRREGIMLRERYVHKLI